MIIAIIIKIFGISFIAFPSFNIIFCCSPIKDFFVKYKEWITKFRFVFVKFTGSVSAKIGRWDSFR